MIVISVNGFFNLSSVYCNQERLLFCENGKERMRRMKTGVKFMLLGVAIILFGVGMGVSGAIWFGTSVAVLLSQVIQWVGLIVTIAGFATKDPG